MERPVKGISRRAYLKFERAFNHLNAKSLINLMLKDTLYKLHTSDVLIPGDKATNNVIVVCKKYHVDTLLEELGMNNPNRNNLTYVPTCDS